MKNGDRPIAPTTKSNYEAQPHLAGSLVSAGLTKREYFAAMAMQGLMTLGYVKLHIVGTDGENSGYTNLPIAAQMSVHMADALLAELEKPTEK